MPYMYIGGAEKYTACLVSALQATGSGSIQVLVTHQESAENPDWNKLAILEPLRSVNVLFWRDICVNHSKSFVLACLLNGLRPRAVIVVNSRVGLDAVAKFGLALSQYSRLYCAYFGLGVQAVGPTFGNRFPRHTLRFATALTDNELTAATLRERYGNLLGQDVVVLPPQVAPVTEEEFNKRLILRRRRIASVARPLRWVWVGRIGRLKGTQILSKLAKRRPIDRFEMFGPLRRSLNDLGLVRPNIFHSAC